MSALRFILAVLIGFSLAVTPVAAAMAGPAAAVKHCDKQDMGDFPCCEKADSCRPDTCATKCLKVVGNLCGLTKPFVPVAEVLQSAEVDKVALRSWPPPSPPPRT